jgi:hypothetical protein
LINPLGLAGYKPRNTAPLKSPKNPPDPTKFKELQKETNAQRKWFDDIWGNIENFFKQKSQSERIDEALVCTKERNMETEETRKPYDVIAKEGGAYVISPPVNIIRSPRPSEIDSPYKCVEVIWRSMPDEPPPGL